MQGHRYVALRVIRVQDGDQEITLPPGTNIPGHITDNWPPSAVRAMISVGHIQFAKIEDTTRLPYLEPAKAKKSAGKAIVDAPEVMEPVLAKSKSKKTVKVRRAEA